MIKRVYGCVFLALVLSGCTSKPTVYIYAKYLDNSQITTLKNTFEQSQQYHVETNDFDFPTGMSQNTLLYSLLLQNPEYIDIAYDLATASGFPIHHSEALAKGNHWYTKDSIALFLFPESKHPDRVMLKQDLANKYIGQKCGKSAFLTLKKEGTFSINLPRGQELADNSIVGRWKYRQYPYLELRTQGSLHSNVYFEIKRFQDADKVSEVDYIKLVSLNPGLLPAGCFFVVGTRI